MNRLSWCFSTLGCSTLSLMEALELAGTFNVSLLEIRALNDRIDLPEMFKDDPASLDALKGSNVSICSLDSSLKLAENTANEREELLQFAQWASRLDVPWVRVFDGGAYSENGDAAAEQAVLNTLEWWRTQKAELNLSCDLMIESHWLFGDSATAARVMEQAPEGTGMLWDTFHPWRLSGEAIEQTWKRLKEWIVHIHFKDGWRTPPEDPIAFCSLGEGEFPLQQLFSMLSGDGFSGAVSLEWENKWHPQLGPLENELAWLINQA